MRRAELSQRLIHLTEAIGPEGTTPNVGAIIARRRSLSVEGCGPFAIRGRPIWSLVMPIAPNQTFRPGEIVVIKEIVNEIKGTGSSRGTLVALCERVELTEHYPNIWHGPIRANPLSFTYSTDVQIEGIESSDEGTFAIVRFGHGLTFRHPDGLVQEILRTCDLQSREPTRLLLTREQSPTFTAGVSRFTLGRGIRGDSCPILWHMGEVPLKVRAENFVVKAVIAYINGK